MTKTSKLKKLFYLLPVMAITACGDRISGSKVPESIYKLAVDARSRSVDDRKDDARRLPAEILTFSNVQPGMIIVDFLGGDGYYSELFNSIVGPSGAVYLQNNSLFLRLSDGRLEKRLEGGRLQNVLRLDSEFADLRLPENVDLIFMGLSYHDIYVPREDPVIMTSREEFFPQIWAALRPGGKILIIDHAAEPGSGSSAAAGLHRIAEDYAVKDLTDAGFELIGTLNSLRNSDDDYSLDIWDEKVFRKTDKFVLLFEKPLTASD